MRRAARTDRNHAEIVQAFRQCGMTVTDLSAVGKGCPDLIVGFRGLNVLVECKSPKSVSHAPEGARQGQQSEWHANWAGQVCVANSVEDAIAKVTAAAKEMGRI